MDIHTEYELGDKVLIKPFGDKEGRIEAIWYNGYSLQYYVYFWQNNKKENEYFLPDELTKL